MRGAWPSWLVHGGVVSRHSPRLPHQVQKKGSTPTSPSRKSRDKTARPFQFSAGGEDKEALRRGRDRFATAVSIFTTLFVSLAHRDWGILVWADPHALFFELLFAFAAMMIFLPLSVHMVPCPANQRNTAQTSNEGSTAPACVLSAQVGNLGAIRFWGVGAWYDDGLLPRFRLVATLAYAPDAEH